MNTCKTKEEWLDLVEKRSLPIANCPREVIEEFNEKLVFRKGGCACGYYKNLKESLSDDDFYVVLGALGITKDKFDSIEDNKCEGAPFHRCVSWWGAFCNPDYC